MMVLLGSELHSETRDIIQGTTAVAQTTPGKVTEASTGPAALIRCRTGSNREILVGATGVSGFPADDGGTAGDSKW